MYFSTQELLLFEVSKFPLSFLAYSFISIIFYGPLRITAVIIIIRTICDILVCCSVWLICGTVSIERAWWG